MDNKDKTIDDLKAQLALAKEREGDYRDARKATLFMLEDLQAATERISKAEQEWVATFDSITDPLFIHDGELRIVRANRAYEFCAQRPFSEFIGMPYFEVFPATGVPFAMCNNSAEGEAESSAEEVSVPELGKIFKTSNYPVRDSGGGYLYSVHLLEDVTADKEAKRRLDEEISTTSALLGVAETFSAVRNPDTMMSECAAAIHKFLGADAVLAYLRDRSTGGFTPSCAHALDNAELPAFMSETPEISSGRIAEVLEGRAPRWLDASDSRDALGNLASMPCFKDGKRVLVIPLEGKIGPLGFFICLYNDSSELGESMKKLMGGIVHQASIALDAIMLYKESVDKAIDLSRKVETIKVMHEMDRNILSTLDSSEILDTAIRLVAKVVACDRATIVRPDLRQGGFVVEACYGIDMPKGSFVPFSDTSSTTVLRSGTVEFIANLPEEKTLLPLEKMLAEAGYRSHLRLPLVAKGEVIAILNVGSKRAGTFGSDSLAILEGLASQIGIALENARLVSGLKQTGYELKKLTVALEHSVNLVLITDMKGVVEYVNPMFSEISGYSIDDAAGQTLRALSLMDLSDDDYEEMFSTVTAGRIWRGQSRHKKKTGGEYWCNTDISPVKDEAGAVTNFMVVQEDITEKMASKERLDYLARYDSLTGLFNRDHFTALLTEWLASAQTEGWEAGLLSIDLDQFKFINETFGHSTGDEFLKSLSGTIKWSVEKIMQGAGVSVADTALAGRFAADEFIVFLPFADERRCMEAAEAVRRSIEAFRFQDVDASSTASVGVSIFPTHASDSKDLITRAQSAMYRAKELGRNVCRLYRPEDMDLEKAHAGLFGKERIIKALKDSRFVPYFQPILDIKNGIISHYEVLARLIGEDGAVLMPGAFIDIAESFGIISGIDRQIIEKTMRFQAALKKKGSTLRFGVNLSGKDLADADLFRFLSDKLEETGADPGALIFEITETAAIRDIDVAVKFIDGLKGLGSQIALDDFGVGFTSFSYLRKMRVDFIKIDGSFIRKLHLNKDDQVFVRAMTDMARGLGIKSVAEFVEEKQTLDLLGTFGVDYAQGYLIGRPAVDILEEEPRLLRA